MNANSSLTPELAEITGTLGEVAQGHGLDFFQTIFELVDYKQLNEVAAYGGFPTRYPHWRFGMDYDRLSKSYSYGLSVIYEMVINNDPCYAYLMRANSMVMQKTVIAHVYAHCDFFKNNYWFGRTNRKMLDQMANHASIIWRLINEIGFDEVEEFVDTCLSLENLIDIHKPFKATATKLTEEEKERMSRDPNVGKFTSKRYMDSYINPKEFLEQQRQRNVEKAKQMYSFPEEPDRDVLGFLLDHGPLKSWQRKILKIIRDEAYYFAPQGQTKILNEGWATYWHSKMMTQLAPLSDAEIVDYCDHYSGIVAAAPGQLNPYKLGIELLRHVERRWDEGKFGLEYMNIDDPKRRAEWNTGAGLGKKKIFEVRKIHNDITFIDEFLDEDFCHEQKLFIYDFDRRNNRYVLSSRNFSEIKQRLLRQLTNFGNPMISVVDANFHNRGELLLKHTFDGVELRQDFATETLRNLYRIWQRPVNIETMCEDTPRRMTFDGQSLQTEKL